MSTEERPIKETTTLETPSPSSRREAELREVTRLDEPRKKPAPASPPTPPPAKP